MWLFSGVSLRVFSLVFQILKLLSDICGCFQVQMGNNLSLWTTKESKTRQSASSVSETQCLRFCFFAPAMDSLASSTWKPKWNRFFRQNIWKGGKKKTCWHQFLDGASGLQLKVGFWEEEDSQLVRGGVPSQEANKAKSGHLVSLATPRRWNA